jgi:heptosyltransferase-3
MNFSKILMIHISGRVGDSLLVTPAITTLKNNFPNAKIDLLVHRNRLDLFENIPNVNLLGSISEKRAWYKGWLSLQKYDYVIVFNHANELINIVKFALRVGKKVIASHVSDKKINTKLFALIARLDSLHHIKAYLRYLTPFEIKNLHTRISLYPTHNEINFAKSALTKRQLSKNSFLVGYQICSFPTRSFRDWPLNNFISLSKKIIKVKPKAFFVIFGAVEDRQKVSSFFEHFSHDQCLDLTGLSLRNTAAVMSLIDLYIGVDTGPTHMMSAFDIPMVAMYHGKFPSKYYAPIGHPNCIAIDHPKKDKCTERDTMADISVDHVFLKLKRFLQK